MIRCLGAVSTVVGRATKAGLSWAEVEEHSDEALETRLYGPRVPANQDRPRPDPAWIHLERKKPGVTLELLHLEYLEEHPDGLRYTAFCDEYRRWLKQKCLSMRQVHRAGEKMFVDYSGKKPSIIDRKTGEVTPVVLVVQRWLPVEAKRRLWRSQMLRTCVLFSRQQATATRWRDGKATAEVGKQQ